MVEVWWRDGGGMVELISLLNCSEITSRPERIRPYTQ